VSNISASSVTSRGAMIAWDDVLCAQRGGLLSYYQITMAASAGSSGQTTTVTATTAVRLAQMNELVPYSRYSVAVRYANSVGLGPPSTPPFYFSTLPDGE